jgi:hypothetical protein
MYNDVVSSIKDIKEKIKPYWQNLKGESADRILVAKHFEISRDFFLVALLVLTAFSAYGLGRLSIMEERRAEIRVGTDESLLLGVESLKQNLTINNSKAGLAPIVASKNGTKYYFPWCSGVDKIKAENKVIFATEDDARKAGLTPASNCPGLVAK